MAGNRQQYIKELKIKVDAKEVDELKDKLDLIYMDTIKSEMSKITDGSKADQKKLQELRSLLGELSRSTSGQTKEAGLLNGRLKDWAAETAKNAFTNLTDTMADFFSDTFSEAQKRIVDMATYDLSSSYITNAAARQQALQYGIVDPAQNYALTQAMAELGMSGQEDLMYMNETQRAKFAERMGYWTSKYTDLANKDFFKTMQEATLEWNELKYDLQLGMVDFFMKNKEVIQNVMVLSIKFMGGTITLLGKILNIISMSRTQSEKSAAASDIIRQYGGAVSTTNVNINNVMNPTSQVLTDKQMLAQAGSLAYTQLIEALKA